MCNSSASQGSPAMKGRSPHSFRGPFLQRQTAALGARLGDKDGKTSANAAARNRAIVRYACSGLFELDDAGDGSRDTTPVGRLFFELLSPQPRQRIKFGEAIVLTRLPLGSNPAAIFQFVQR